MAPARQSQLACTQLGQGRGAGAGPQLIGRRADDLEIEIEAVGLSSLQDRTCWRALEPRWRITGRHAQRMLFSFVTPLRKLNLNRKKRLKIILAF